MSLSFTEKLTSKRREKNYKKILETPLCQYIKNSYFIGKFGYLCGPTQYNFGVAPKQCGYHTNIPKYVAMGHCYAI